MIWATVTSSSCFCWEYNRASSFGFKEHNLIYWPSGDVRVQLSPGLLESVFALTQHVLLLTKLLALLCFILYSKNQNLPVILGIPWLPDFAFQSTKMKRDTPLVFILDVVGLHRTNQLQILWHQGLGHILGLLWYWKWLALETNQEHSVVFEIAPNIVFCTFDWPWVLLHF